MSVALPLKYRPQNFSEVSDQESVIKILERQIETNSFKNCILFYGPSGTGKTTIARIFANKINNGLGEPIEIDAASNNGVDNIRNIIEQADQRSLDSEYKVYILDEAHMLTNQSWNALLKLVEEPPKYTVFIFCTTEFHKVPETIQNRCQQFRLTKCKDKSIFKRLEFISKEENFNYTEEALDHITKLASGSMRQAIAYLDKCKDFGNITLDNVLTVLGDFSYEIYFKLTNALIDKNSQEIINIIENIYNSGNDLKVFIDMYLEFIMDLTKYILFKSYDIIKIPQRYSEQVNYTINVENAIKYFNHLLDSILELKVLLKGDNMQRTTVEIFLLTKI